MSPPQKKSSRKPPPKLGQSTTRPWVKMVVGLLVAALVIGGVAALLVDGGDNGSDVTAGSNDTTVSTGAGQTVPTAPAAESAAGKPCVAPAGAAPAGAPAVPVRVGPPPTELVVEDLQAGDGAAATAGSTVTVDYIGVSCSTGAIFDASYGREPATFGVSQVIPGWQQGLEGMQVGGTRLLAIPPELAYGTQGSPPDIAPDETLWFVVELKDVQTG